METPLHMIIHKLNRLNVLHRIYIHKAADKNGLYFGQPPILEFIADHDNCTQKQVADFMQVSPPSIATSIKRMQKAGLLKKTMDASDQRYNRISITKQGAAAVKSCRADFDRVDALMFAGFSEQEQEQFCSYVERLTANLLTDEFVGKSFFSLIEEEKRLHTKNEGNQTNTD